MSSEPPPASESAASSAPPRAPSLRVRAGRPVALSLNVDYIVETIDRLQRRIQERFPGSGLGDLCADLHAIAVTTKTRLDWVGQPNLWLRTATTALVVLVAAGVIAAVAALVTTLPAVLDDPIQAIQTFESGIQDVVFIGIALAFLITAESRLKRKRALDHIRELRAVAHIADMHQLTKDPDRLLRQSENTASSPQRTLTRAQLGRYLDYCSELLSLTSKIAALYAERLSDPVVLQAVDEVETLTTGLSRKIWQKIMILDTALPAAPTAPELM